MTVPQRRGCAAGVEPNGMVSAAWRSAIDDWLTVLHLRGLSPRTIRLRQYHLRYLAARADDDPMQLSCDGLRRLFAAHDWSPEYRKSIRASVRSFCAHHRICDNGDCLPAVRVIHPRPRPVSDALWRQLAAVDNTRTLLMLRLAAEAGLRRGEVAALRTDDLMFDHDGWSLIVRGKGDKQRVVPINDGLAYVLQCCPGGFVFPNRCGGHLSAEHVGKTVNRLMPPGCSMHKLRHRYASRGYAATHDLRAVQEALGHSSVATTQRYIAVSSRDVRAVSEAASRSDENGRTNDEKPPPEHPR